jgi:hypothetical protein
MLFMIGLKKVGIAGVYKGVGMVIMAGRFSLLYKICSLFQNKMIHYQNKTKGGGL